MLGGLTTQKISAGLFWQVVPDLFAVRACDVATRDCRQGVAKPVARVTLRQVGATGATVTLQTEYHVGPTQTLTNGLPVSPTRVTMSIHAGVAPMPSLHSRRIRRNACL
ncbi:hypothetical protein [Paraburkholderia tropica]|uniref:hypothetical protein n=1 Tax=Paraburkholderia tropica TaxID=92647 RepID=UPI002ABE0FB6|nr:hypothetical protein [Paraburkholderia tropica]